MKQQNEKNMKSSISFLLVVICTVVLAAQQSQAKKGCNAYGHACYGGHGKRSLGPLTDESRLNGAYRANEREEVHPEELLRMIPNEAALAALESENEIEAYPRYRLIKIMKSWLGGHLKRPAERTNDIDYLTSGEAYSRGDNTNTFN